MRPLVAIDFYCAVHKILHICQDEASIELYWSGLLNQYQEYDIVVLSDQKPYWRTLKYPDYKGNRPTTKLEGFRLVEEIGRSIVPNMLELEGLEADDWAGLLVKYHARYYTRPLVELKTVDTDWLQLVSDSVVWSNYGRHLPQYRGNSEAIQWAYDRLGVFINSASDIARVKYQLGDSVDNVPGGLTTDLVSLQGPSWESSLESAGYDIEELLREVGQYYA